MNMLASKMPNEMRREYEAYRRDIRDALSLDGVTLSWSQPIRSNIEAFSSIGRSQIVAFARPDPHWLSKPVELVYFCHERGDCYTQARGLFEPAEVVNPEEGTFFIDLNTLFRLLDVDATALRACNLIKVGQHHWQELSLDEGLFNRDGTNYNDFKPLARNLIQAGAVGVVFAHYNYPTDEGQCHFSRVRLTTDSENEKQVEDLAKYLSSSLYDGLRFSAEDTSWKIEYAARFDWPWDSQYFSYRRIHTGPPPSEGYE